jgi:hypothetical protein
MNATRWILFVYLSLAFASATAEHGAPSAFAFSLRGASANEVLEIASVALAPMRFDLTERTLSSSDANLRAIFRSGTANQIVLAGTPNCIVAVITVEAASSAANAEQIRRTIARHFATNLRAAAGARVVFHDEASWIRSGTSPEDSSQRTSPSGCAPSSTRAGTRSPGSLHVLAAAP